MRIGIDLGGTKIEGVVLAADNSILLRRRHPTPQNDYPSIVRSIADLINALEQEVAQVCSVGIGTPGTISPYSGRIKNANTVVLNGKNLAADLEAATGKSLYFANDANCLALSEAVDGAAAGAKSVFGVIIGTGTGGGLVFDGQLIVGANAIAGEWGHNPLPFSDASDRPAVECYCGKTGCIETYLCGAGFVRLHHASGGAENSAEEIADRIRSADARAICTLDRYAQLMARALASVINVFDPEVVVLGGGLSNLPSLVERVTQALPAFVFSDHVATKISRALHGDSSGVRGAAWLPP